MILPDVLTWPPNHFHWWTVAVLLLLCELMLPAAYFLGLSIAAGIMGVALYLHPGVEWDLQLLAFALLSIATVKLWRRYANKREPTSDHPGLNRRTEQYIGRIVTLETASSGGVAQARLDGTLWRVRCDSLPAGSKVRITGADGADLIGVPVED